MESLTTTRNEPQRLQIKSKSLYDYLPDRKLCELSQEEKRNEIKNIMQLLEMNYNRKYDNKKIIAFFAMMDRDGYGIQRIKDCFENLIRNHPYPNFTYCDLTGNSINLFTQYDILKSGRSYNEFIRCETPSKETFFWDKKNGELPKILKEKPLRSNFVYFFDTKTNKPACWDASYDACPYPHVSEKEFNELLNKELNARLKCNYFSENIDEISESFLKNYTKII